MCNIAIVGATGVVGSKFIEVLQERGIKANYYLFASFSVRLMRSSKSMQDFI